MLSLIYDLWNVFFQMALNSRITNNKFGSIEKMLNRYIIFFAVILVMEMIISTILTMEKGVEYLDTDEPFNLTSEIEKLKLFSKYSKTIILGSRFKLRTFSLN